MSDVTIRRLGAHDLDLLMEWRELVLRSVFDLPDGKSVDAGLLDMNRAYYEKHLADGSHVAGLALLDGEAAGCGAVCLYDEMPSPDNRTGCCAYLMNVFTLPAARGRGVAGTLVDWLVEQARGAGAGKIYLETTNMARPLYAKAGFEPMRDYMKLAGRGGRDAAAGPSSDRA